MSEVGTQMSPRQLLGAARELMTKPSPGTVGLWPREAAVLARQALENQMTIILTTWIPGVESTNARTKLICLKARMQDRELAAGEPCMVGADDGLPSPLVRAAADGGGIGALAGGG